MKYNLEYIEQAFAGVHPVAIDNDGRKYVYVEVGKYKPYKLPTIRAAQLRGYKVVTKVRNSVYYVYNKETV